MNPRFQRTGASRNDLPDRYGRGRGLRARGTQVEREDRAGVFGAAVPEDPFADDSHRRRAGKPLVRGDEDRAVPQRLPEQFPEGGDAVTAEENVAVRDPAGEQGGSDGHVGGQTSEFPAVPAEEGRVHLSPAGVLYRADDPTLPRESMSEGEQGRHGDERHTPPETEPFRRRHPHAQAGERPGPGGNGDGRDVPGRRPGGGEKRFHGGDVRPGRPRAREEKDLGPNRAAGHQRHAPAGRRRLERQDHRINGRGAGRCRCRRRAPSG